MAKKTRRLTLGGFLKTWLYNEDIQFQAKLLAYKGVTAITDNLIGQREDPSCNLLIVNRLFSDINVLLGSVATRMSCGGIFNNYFTASVQENLSVK